MHSPQFHARRANLDDLSGLRQLWKSSSVSEPCLEKRLTEFQIVEGVPGVFIACAGLEISERQGNIHTWIVPNTSIREQMEQMLWNRIGALIKNHGLIRVWTLENGAFWSAHGFSAPNDSVCEFLPASFGLPSQKWMLLPLRNESTESILLERQFELLQENQLSLRQKTLNRIRILRWVAVTVAVAIIVAFIWLAWAMSEQTFIPNGTPKS